MTLELSVTGPTGAAVHVWHCSRDGGDALHSDGITGEPPAPPSTRRTATRPRCATSRGSASAATTCSVITAARAGSPRSAATSDAGCTVSLAVPVDPAPLRRGDAPPRVVTAPRPARLPAAHGVRRGRLTPSGGPNSSPSDERSALCDHSAASRSGVVLATDGGVPGPVGGARPRTPRCAGSREECT